ncbi:DUF6665 family protein [Sphingomonas turrisvirgatae]|uniref:DUF6665 family protein n=1 Tax=Sphingomonas turrisvirgatae TaxID=1888892 RepID=UPI0009A1D3C6|nr:DUF6665 family protein [Sphingomonas turrisvirgatae]
MSIRPPRILSSKSRSGDVYQEVQREILSEKAATLGRAGKSLEAALARLRAGEGKDRAALLQAAAEAAHAYLIQREAAGIHGLGAPIEDFGVPGEVRERIGAAYPVTGSLTLPSSSRSSGL